MLLHDLPLFLVEWAVFEQYVLGYADLPHVMHDARPSQGNALLLREAQPPPQRLGIGRQPIAVSLRIGILRFDTQREAEEDCLGIFEFVGVLFQPQKRAGSSQELLAVHGLVQKVICTGPYPSNALIDTRQSSDQHNWNEASLGIELYRLTYFEPRLARYHDI